MSTLRDKLQKMFRFNQKPAAPPITLTETAVADLMRQVEATQEDQYSCEETFALLDEYVELVTSEQDAAALMPLVERHLHHCPNCRGHYDMLLTILQTE